MKIVFKNSFCLTLDRKWSILLRSEAILTLSCRNKSAFAGHSAFMHCTHVTYSELFFPPICACPCIVRAPPSRKCKRRQVIRNNHWIYHHLTFPASTASGWTIPLDQYWFITIVHESHRSLFPQFLICTFCTFACRPPFSAFGENVLAIWHANRQPICQTFSGKSRHASRKICWQTLWVLCGSSRRPSMDRTCDPVCWPSHLINDHKKRISLGGMFVR